MLSSTNLVDAVESDQLGGVRAAAWLDYGFANCRTEDEVTKLFGLYQDLVCRLGATDQELHQNLLAETLPQYIEDKHKDKAGASNYLPWFLENKERIVGQLLPPAESSYSEDDIAGSDTEDGSASGGDTTAS